MRAATSRPPSPSQEAAARRLEAKLGGLTLLWDPEAGSPRSLLRLGGYLTERSVASPREVAWGFLLENLDLFGLEDREVTSLVEVVPTSDPKTGTVHFGLQQTVAGVPVLLAALRFHVTRDGRLLSVSGPVHPGVEVSTEPALSPEAAAAVAAGTLFPDLPFTPTILGGSFAASNGSPGSPVGRERRTRLEAGPFSRPIDVSLVIVPNQRPGVLAWAVHLEAGPLQREASQQRQEAGPPQPGAGPPWRGAAPPDREASTGTDDDLMSEAGPLTRREQGRAASPLPRAYRVLVDASTGEVIEVLDLVVHEDPDGRVVDGSNPVPDFDYVAPSNYVIRPFPISTAESPIGWFDTSQDFLIGNNAKISVGSPGSPGPSEPDHHFDYAFGTTSSAATNLFEDLNLLHDLFYARGFVESNGNYQTDNFGLGGLGNDPVKGTVRWGGCRDNAFFTFSLDGTSGTMSHCVWACQECPDLDGNPLNGGEIEGTYDFALTAHEYTHGVEVRLIGTPVPDPSCLSGSQPVALREAWSDAYGAFFTGSPFHDAYTHEGDGLGRSLENDLTYGNYCNVDLQGSCGGHVGGMIWSGTLWNLRKNLMARLGDAAGALEVEELVLGALEMTPCQPDFLDARNAILLADQDRNGGANQGLIWQVFAKRGMGASASTTGPNDISPIQAFDVPPSYACTSPPAVPAGVGASATGNRQITVAWNAVAGAAGYEVRRSRTGCAGVFDTIGWAQAPATSFVDTDVDGGLSYSYTVLAFSALGLNCMSAASGCAAANATGACSAAPSFAGLASANGASAGGCGITLAWPAATRGCPLETGTTVSYNVYRATAPFFTPRPQNRVANTTATSYVDPVYAGATYYYIVRAEDSTSSGSGPQNGGREETNTVVVAATATGPRTLVRSWDFEAATNEGWTTSVGDTSGPFVRVDPNATFYGTRPVQPEDDATPGAGVKAWVTGNGPPGERAGVHDLDGLNMLFSPTFNAAGASAVVLSYARWFHSERLLSSLEVELDNGVDPPVVTESHYHNESRWTRVEIDLARFAPPTATMSVDFRAYGDANPFTDVGIDDVKIETASLCLAPRLRYQSTSVDDGQLEYGNGNGLLEPGEIARLAVTIANEGTQGASGVEAVLTSLTSGVTVLNPYAAFPNIAAGGSVVSVAPHFLVEVSPALACTQVVQLALRLQSDDGRFVDEIFTLNLGTPQTATLFEDSFESDQGWTVSGGVTSGAWVREAPFGTFQVGPANPDSDSSGDIGDQCYATENSSNGDPDWADVDGGTTTLTSPLIDVSGWDHAIYTFDRWYYVDASNASDSFQARANPGGSFWRTLDFTTTRENLWQSRSYDLVQFMPLTATLQLSFETTDGAADNTVEAGVDNVKIVGQRRVCAPFAPPALDPPNPVGWSLLASRIEDHVGLVWTAPPSDATHDPASLFRIYRSTSPAGDFSALGAAETPSFTDSGAAQPPTRYFYTIVSENAGGTSGEEPLP